MQLIPTWVYWIPVITALVSIAGALLVAWLSVRWAVGRFSQEKWLERKIDAYTRALEALHLMRDVGERTLEHLHSGPHPTIHVNNEFAAEWYPRWRDGYADLKKYSDMGQLLFSPEASVLLAEVRNGLGRIQDPWGMGDEERAAAELKVLGPAMESLKTFAQKDLDAASLSRSRWSLTKH